MTPREAAELYLSLGWVPIVVPYRGKGPTGYGWQKTTPEEARVAVAGGDFDGETNVGVLIGAPSGDLCDLDLDAPEAIAIADRFLPPTLTFGRPGAPRSHRLYRVPGVTTVKHEDPIRKGSPDLGKACILEVRGTGVQTVFPGSVHVTGESIDFSETDPEELAAPPLAELTAAATRLSVAVALARVWPGGGRHEAQLALAGGLLEGGMDEEDALAVLCAVCFLVGDEDPAKRATTIRHTRDRLDIGDRVTTWGTLAQRIPQAVVAWVQRLLGMGKEEIRVTGDVQRAADSAIDALVRAGTYYRRAGTIVRVVRDADPPPLLIREPGTPTIVTVPDAALREAIASGARWVRVGANGATTHIVPPDWVVPTVVARGHWPKLRPLEGLTEAPVLRPDGSVLDVAGYDAATGVLYEPRVGYPAVPGVPSAMAVADAVAALDDVLGDFTWEAPEHRAGAFAAILTPVAAYAYGSGRSPLFLFDASTPGSGKSLLAQVCGIVGTGRLPAAAQFTPDDAEMEKRITAYAIGGDRVVLLDNVTGRLGGKSLCAALTVPTWEGRVLGQSKKWTGPMSTVWYATANNVQLGADMDRRVVHIRLDPGVERPELRTGFRHANLLDYVAANRPRLLAAALTVLRGYVAAGRPVPEPDVAPWGSFEGWRDLVVRALVWAGLPDLGAARAALSEDAEPEAEWRRTFVSELAVATAGKAMKAKDVAELCNRPGALRDAAQGLIGGRGGTDAVAPHTVGVLLRSLKGRIVGGKRVHSKNGRTGVAEWWAE